MDHVYTTEDLYGPLYSVDANSLEYKGSVSAASFRGIAKALRLTAGDTLVTWPNPCYSEIVYDAVTSVPDGVKVLCPESLFPNVDELVSLSRNDTADKVKFLFDLTFSRIPLGIPTFQYETSLVEYDSSCTSRDGSRAPQDKKGQKRRLYYPPDVEYGNFSQALLSALRLPIASQRRISYESLSYVAIAAELAKAGLAMVTLDSSAICTGQNERLREYVLEQGLIQEVINLGKGRFNRRDDCLALTVSSKVHHEVIAYYCDSHGSSLLEDPSFEMRTPEELVTALPPSPDCPLLANISELLKYGTDFSPSSIELVNRTKGYERCVGDIAYRPKLVRTTRLRARETRSGLSRAKLFTNASAGTSLAALERLQDVYVNATYEDEFLEPGDILISRLSSFGSTPTISLIPSSLPCPLVTTSNYLVLRLKEQNYSKAVLLYLYLSSKHARELIERLGGPSRKSLLWDQIASVEIPPEVINPPTKNQMASIDDLFSRREECEEEYVRAVQALRSVDLEIGGAFDRLFLANDS